MGLFSRDKNHHARPAERINYRDQNPDVLTPEVIFTFMQAADERSQQFSLQLIVESVEAVTKRGHGIRARGILKDLRWLARKAEKEGIHWEVTP